MGQDNAIYKCSIKLSFSSKGQDIKATETKQTLKKNAIQWDKTMQYTNVR